jgi:adenine phosphoribosyltransferase
MQVYGHVVSPSFLLKLRRTGSGHKYIVSLWPGSSVVEQRIENPCVGGSIPPLATSLRFTLNMNLSSFLRAVPDFPKEGVLFWDISPLLADPEAFQQVIQKFSERYKDQHLDAIVALESRGFLFGAPLALKLKLPFIPLRKPGKLPSATHSCSYELEYGNTTLEIHQDGLLANQKVLIVDDLIATGGTVAASIELVEKCQAKVQEVACVIEIEELEGKKLLKEIPLYSLIKK